MDDIFFGSGKDSSGRNAKGPLLLLAGIIGGVLLGFFGKGLYEAWTLLGREVWRVMKQLKELPDWLLEEGSPELTGWHESLRRWRPVESPPE